MKSSIKICISSLCGILLVAASFLSPVKVAADPEGRELPMAVRGVLSQAATLVQEKRFNDAVALLTAFQAKGKASSQKQAASSGYRHAEIDFAIGTCHLMRQAYKEAVKAYRSAVQKEPGHVSAWLNMAKAYYESNDPSQAARCFEQAYDHDGRKSGEHLYFCAVAYQLAGELQPSLAAYEKLMADHGAAMHPQWRENYVQALLSAGRARTALPHIRALADHYHGDRQIQWQEILLHNYLQLGMRREARDYALFLTRHDPLRGKWWKALTHVDLDAGRYEEALAALMIYSYLTPLKDEELKLLADLNLQLGIPGKAAPLYEQMLSRRPDERLVQNLALALRRLGKSEQALAVVDRFAASGGGRKNELLMARADLLYDLRRFEEAFKAYRRAAESNVEKAGRAWLMAGYAAMQASDLDSGRNAFQKAASFKDHRRAALLAMQQLPKKGG